ncbi:unannotated protein [freshwater metagenome]|uniref:Unannotated protein n=1 Tax=freshwater metagenome TaxID=449393 RepID=A0A6J7HIG8_9ZZZZ
MRLVVPRHVWVVGAVVALVALVVAAIVIAQLEDTRRSIDQQVAERLSRVDRSTDAIEGATVPVLRDAERDRTAAKRLTGLSTLLAQQATPLARDLRRRDAGTQLQKAGALSDNLVGVDAGAQITRSADLARTLLGADVGSTVRDVDRLAATLQGAGLPGLSTAVTGVTDELTTQDRLRRFLVRGTSIFGQVRAMDTVPKLTAAAQAVRTRVVPYLEKIVALLTETQALNRDTRDIARDTNRHVVSLDRKLGGELPVP